MSSQLYVTLSALVVLAVTLNGLTASVVSATDSALMKKSMEVVNHNELIKLLNVSKDTALGAMMEKLKKLNQSELNKLMNDTFGTNHTLMMREGKQFFGGGYGGGYGGGFGGGVSPLLLALILGRDHGFGGGFGGGYGGYPPPAPASSSSGMDNLGTLAALTLLGLALIGRMPTQG